MKKTLGLYASAAFIISCLAASTASADFILRERIINIDTINNNSSTTAAADINHNVVPELDLSYFVGSDKTFSLELMATASHSSMKSSVSGASLGDVWVVPPTLTAQYHFFADQPWQFYIGAGANFTRFYPSNQPAGTSITFKDSIGPVAQVGMDMYITKSWMLNLDVKKIYMRPDVSINGGPYVTDKLDPYIFGVGVGYKF